MVRALMDTEPGLQDRIRGEVRALLARSQAYRELPEDERARLAAGMTEVGAFLADQDWLTRPPRAVDALRELVKTVDLPDFVASLVQGVFGAIVNASIQQMRAYAELVASVAGAVDEFGEDRISDADARAHLKDAYPGVLADGADEECDEREAKLVRAAKRELARQRQQLLATMVLMGINRIVVTDG